MNHRRIRTILVYTSSFIWLALVTTPFSREGCVFLFLGLSLLWAWWAPGEPFPLIAAIRKWGNRRKVGP